MSFEIRLGQGEKQQSFSVHHDIITRRSEYLHDLRRQRMNCSSDSSVINLDDDPEVFATYLHTVYFGAEPLKERVAAMEENNPRQQKSSNSESGDDGEGKNSDSNGAAPDTDETQATSNDDNGILKEELVEKFLIDLHLLAVKLRDIIAADLAIDELVELYRHERSTRKEMVAFVYQSTPKDGALRALYRDLHTFRVKDHWVHGDLEETDYPFDFVRDVLRKVWVLKPSRAGREIKLPYQRELDATHYHYSYYPFEMFSATFQR
jgi:hypothetical protein